MRLSSRAAGRYARILHPLAQLLGMRILIQALIVGAILFGGAASLLRRKKVLPLGGMLLAFAAILLGGASVPINQTLHDGPAIGSTPCTTRPSRSTGSPGRAPTSSTT
jgi:hypothetical protein